MGLTSYLPESIAPNLELLSFPPDKRQMRQVKEREEVADSKERLNAGPYMDFELGAALAPLWCSLERRSSGPWTRLSGPKGRDIRVASLKANLLTRRSLEFYFL